ncbi:DNA polymerase ligase N-terminal domain-containing protein [Rubinisphaera sp.]|uniref:DNA polymerase ligase N-terminal domain-containing protein n=1 Tax=Rubinisphaera sp. TaxID=2024857 RepID=UPI000C0DE29B|nr:DNA polymerase ligase N-terminal domain-containing protein [Rubinisphaera sp.]MBV07620.1 hypothetical protein [Rubinisphaera sp.]HCS55475.1 hypothetical protein [Planctomycetaceae bacterium]|tara:strand:+ start:514 stop:924 length:411 start_codon:yes stop_codon:yes gene_type:complete
MPRFVLLEHDHPTLHWDFMLESASTLKTWRLPEPFVAMNGHLEQELHQFAETEIKLTVFQLPDHRMQYLDYEGPVSGNRGCVKRIDQGMYILLSQSENSWEVRIEGEKSSGFLSLTRKKNSSSEEWILLFLPELRE